MAHFFSLTRTLLQSQAKRNIARHRLWQGIWMLVALLGMLHVLLTLPSQWLAAEQAQAHGQVGVFLLGLFHVVVSIGIPLLYIGCGGFLCWRAPKERMALYTAFTLATFGATVFAKTDVLTATSSLWLGVILLLAFLAQVLYFLYFFLFPDGRFMPRWVKPLAPLFVLLLVCLYFLPGLAFSVWFLRYGVLWSSLGLCIVIITVQVYRYWRVSNVVQRQQTKWVVLGLTLFPLTLLIGQGINVLAGLEAFHPLIARESSFGLTSLILALIPLSIVLATMRYKLWDIDRLLNRAMVYTIMTACVIGLYSLVVGGLALLFQLHTNVLTSLIATGLVAVLVQPLRTMLQHNINRVMYGERDDPRTMLFKLGQRLEATLSPHAMLETIVETLAQALKFPYAAVRVQQESGLEMVTSYGNVPSLAEEHLFHLPLIAQKERVGEMLFAPRSPDETFTAADQKLLREVAHQVGMAVHTMRLTEHLQQVTLDLQHSRERLILAREEERRRIRRDLHDGLAPTLAALALSASTIGDLIEMNPTAAKNMANEFQSQIRATVGDIRRLVYDLRPPALDQLGLLPAICEYITHGARPASAQNTHQGENLEVSMQAPTSLPALPAAVEVAAYRIVQEALMNVRRHAQARTCQITISLPEGPQVLQIEVLDDGRGIPEEYRAGVGLNSMKERATELGGTCVIEERDPTGTRICVRLPLQKESE